MKKKVTKVSEVVIETPLPQRAENAPIEETWKEQIRTESPKRASLEKMENVGRSILIDQEKRGSQVIDHSASSTTPSEDKGGCVIRATSYCRNAIFPILLSMGPTMIDSNFKIELIFAF